MLLSMYIHQFISNLDGNPIAIDYKTFVLVQYIIKSTDDSVHIRGRTIIVIRLFSI
jgi:hypothetical protein